ncbi:MAG: dethiobiotin synthase [Candidatus Berkiella sp.]
MTGIFISATGTEIGKTYITQQLLHYDSTHEQCLSASKPIISGWPQSKEEIQHTDTAILLRAQHLPLTDVHIQQCSPWRYTAPLTPSMAGKLEGKTIDEKMLILHCQRRIEQAKKQDKIHLIEGVGGIMAPITDKMTCLSWLKQLECCCILVTGTYLGALSHTLTAHSALTCQQIPVHAVIVNETPNSTVSLAQTVDALSNFLAPLAVLALPFSSCEEDIAMIYSRTLEVTKKVLSCDLA